MAKTLRWGLLGTGAIARKFAAGLLESRTGRLAAVGSRTLGAAEGFTRDFPAKAHGSYDELLADASVDVVYLSTPHPMHAAWAIRACEAGKHLLCEKPLTMNRAEAASVFAAAAAHGVFCMEAFMYRCHPQTARVVELIRGGAIGPVRLVHANFSFRAPLNLRERLFKKELGGGGILDVGCYGISMARLIAGAAAGAPFAEPVELKAVGCLGGESGVDEFAVASLKFASGMVAQVAAGLRVSLENAVRIHGDDGSIFIPSPWVVAREAGVAKIFLERRDSAPEEILIETDRGIYAIEADVVAEHLGAKEAPAMSWADSLGNMSALDRWRAEIGMRYPGEA